MRWVLKISDFLQMELPLPKHEELQAPGVLVFMIHNPKVLN